MHVEPSIALWVLPVARYMALGLGTTILMAVLSVIASVAVGLVLGVLLTLPVPAVRLPVRLYIEVWRGSPIIITLFFIFFSLPTLHVNVGAFTAATIGLTLWGSANAAEIVRGAVLSIPRGQFEAASALGLSWRQTMTHVIVAQAIRRMIPPMMGLLTNLIQSTSLAAVIGVLEILESGQRSIERLTVDSGNSHAVAILGAVLVVFFVICTPLTRLSRRLETRLRS